MFQIALHDFLGVTIILKKSRQRICITDQQLDSITKTAAHFGDSVSSSLQLGKTLVLKTFISESKADESDHGTLLLPSSRSTHALLSAQTMNLKMIKQMGMAVQFLFHQILTSVMIVSLTLFKHLPPPYFWNSH